MSRTPLSYYCSYYVDTKVDPAAVTNYGGIFLYLDLILLTDLPKLVNEYLPKKSLRGWQHAEHIGALLALNLTGGDCVDDPVKLGEDPGISLYMGQIAQAVGARNRQFKRGGQKDIPSLTSVREWLDQFHNAEEDTKRGYGQVFIPEANEALSDMRGLNREFVKRGWEVCRGSGAGTHGHIAIKTNSIPRAIAYLERNGVAVDMSTAKGPEGGPIQAVYLKDEVGGFAVHLLQAK